MGSSGASKSTSTQNAPAELSGLLSNTGQNVSNIQNRIYGGEGPSEFENQTIRQVAQASPNQQYAASLPPQLSNDPYGNETISSIRNAQNYGAARPSVGNVSINRPSVTNPNVGKVTGAGLMTDPAILAAQRAFREGAAKNIVDQQTLSGRGSMSSVDDALVRGEGQFMLPIIQEGLAREERGLDRQLGLDERTIDRNLGLDERAIERNMGLDERGIERQMGIDERAIDRGINTNLNAAGLYGNLSGADLQRRLSSFNAASQEGQVQRGIDQETANAPYEDFLRRQGLGEQALFGPMGQLPSTIGQSVKSSGGGK